MKWLIYALGGGYGHITRALSLAKVATHRGIHCSILYNSPLAHRAIPFYEERFSQVNFEYVPSNFERSDVTKFMENYFSDLQGCDRVIVDTFPRGIAGELVTILPKISCPKVFISRHLNQKYIESIDIYKSLQSFDAVIRPEDSLPPPSYLTHFFATESWLLCSSNEILSQKEARKYLQVVQKTKAPVIGFLGSGHQKEIFQGYQWAKRLRADFPQFKIIFLTLETLDEDSELCRKIWPVMKIYRALDLLICSGGHNAINEAKVTNTPALVIPRKRRYDRQDLRADGHAIAAGYEDICLACESLQKNPHEKRRPDAKFTNGAQKAYKIIEGLVES
ncbi:MAG: glycosyltransferase [Myxococcota bacterium]|nr:glycosyltransferase [Myxococcota bacterium]